MSDHTQKETYDHLASRTIVDGRRVSEIPAGEPHPDIFGENLVEAVEIDTRPPEGFREVLSSASFAARTTGAPVSTSQSRGEVAGETASGEEAGEAAEVEGAE